MARLHRRAGGYVGDRRHVSAAKAGATEVPGPRHPADADVPALPGAVHLRDRVHEQRRRTPVVQGSVDPGHHRQNGPVIQVAGSPSYTLSVAVKQGANPATAQFVYFLVGTNNKVQLGDTSGLHPVAAGDVTVSLLGKVTAAKGYTILNAVQVNARGNEFGHVRPFPRKTGRRSRSPACRRPTWAPAIIDITRA